MAMKRVWENQDIIPQRLKEGRNRMHRCMQRWGAVGNRLQQPRDQASRRTEAPFRQQARLNPRAAKKALVTCRRYYFSPWVSTLNYACALPTSAHSQYLLLFSPLPRAMQWSAPLCLWAQTPQEERGKQIQREQKSILGVSVHDRWSLPKQTRPQTGVLGPRVCP